MKCQAIGCKEIATDARQMLTFCAECAARVDKHREVIIADLFTRRALSLRIIQRNEEVQSL